MATSTLLNDSDDLPVDPRKGHTTGDLGPSDTSDSGSDTAGLPNTRSDTDSQGTGDRASVDPDMDGETGPDIIPDEIVDEETVARESPGDEEEDAIDTRKSGTPGK